MPCGAVIPDSEGIFFPANAACKIRVRSVLVQILEQGLGFLFCPSLNLNGEHGIYVKCFATRDGVPNDQGMNGVLRGEFGIANATAWIGASIAPCPKNMSGWSAEHLSFRAFVANPAKGFRKLCTYWKTSYRHQTRELRVHRESSRVQEWYRKNDRYAICDQYWVS